MNLKTFEEAIVIAKKHGVKNLELTDDDGRLVKFEFAEELHEMPDPSFIPGGDTMMTEQQFNEADDFTEGGDYLITNPMNMGG